MYYEFREARHEELGACFALREACYRIACTKEFVDCRGFREYDDHSRHFVSGRVMECTGAELTR